MLSPDKHHRGCLSFISSSVEHAIPCLDSLFGLPDSHFQELDLSYKVPLDEAGEPPQVCPLPNGFLDKLLLQNENRENRFSFMAFTPKQSRVLAASGTSIGLYACLFPDGGAGFVDAASQHSSLTKLSLYENLHFNDSNFVWCLNYLNLEYLGLSDMTLDDGQSTAEINYLRLEGSTFGDEEALQVLSGNVRAERGPKGLALYGRSPFHSELFGEFMNALRGNTYFERLDLGYISVRSGSVQALVAALRENRGLTHLGLKGCYVDDRCWKKLMDAIAEHPSLRTLSSEDIEIEYENGRVFERHHTIHALAGMLASNEHVDDVKAVDA
jgi:hypothetical protein